MRTYAYFARTGLVSRREMQVYLVALYLIHDDIPNHACPFIGSHAVLKCSGTLVTMSNNSRPPYDARPTAASKQGFVWSPTADL